MRLAPSILSADFAYLFRDIKKVIDLGGADLIHIDVMDGHFVPNITVGIPVVSSIRKKFPDALLDVHLMIDNPDLFIEDFAKAGADYITVHAEATVHLQRTLTQIRSLGKKAGVSLNPSTPLCVLDYVLDQTDLVLIMTVNPGFGGQAFLPGSLKKIADLKKMIKKTPYSIEIEVDGGISPDNVHDVTKAGAGIIVAGSSIFSVPDMAKAVEAFRRNAYEVRL